MENEYRADTDARVSGNWDTDGAVTVSALNGSTVELHSDAVRAAVIGGSGVWLKNAISNDANTTVSSAAISSDGTQTYTAQIMLIILENRCQWLRWSEYQCVKSRR